MIKISQVLKMTEEEVLETLVLPAIATAAQSMPGLALPEVTAELSLYGTDRAVLDSLNLVSFIFIVEAEIKRALGREVRITAEDVFRAERNPFEDLRSFSAFLKTKLGENA